MAGIFLRLAIDRPQPCFFPKNQTAGLTPAVRGTVATRVQMNCLADAAPANREDRVAGLVRPLVDLKPFTAESEHLRHERHAFELTGSVERRKDFFLATDLDPVSDAQSCDSAHMNSWVNRPKATINA